MLAAFGICLVAAPAASPSSRASSPPYRHTALVGGHGRLTGQQRFTFGNPYLLGGLGQVPALIGLFGMSEILNQVFELGVSNKKKMKVGAWCRTSPRSSGWCRLSSAAP